jgi:hypothetical protein
MPFVDYLNDPRRIQRFGSKTSDKGDDGGAQVSICGRRQGILGGRVSVEGIKER